MWGVVSLGSTTHSSWEREQNDFYATNPIAIKLLLEQEKKLFLENPPKVIYVCSGRVNCVKNWDFDRYSSTALAHAWFVWEKGYKWDTIVKWIN